MGFVQRRLVFCFALCIAGVVSKEGNSSETDQNTTSLIVDNVLEHQVVYEPLPSAPDYKSDVSYDPRGMEHVYLLANTFLDLIQRKKALPTNMTITQILEALSGSHDKMISFLSSHWQDFLLQYIGVITVVIFGLVLAITIPIIGFFFWCCRCAGKCGAYPKTYYDKKSDSCKRLSLGILLSVFVIAAVFGAVASFVTNQYTYSGWQGVSRTMDDSLEDAGSYFQHAGESIEVLLVTNFAEMEEVIGDILNDSGPILKSKLADITEAIAINDLTNIVSGLSKVKKNLKSVTSDLRSLEEKVSQLRDGLSRSQDDLSSALKECNSNTACANFIQEFDLNNDLTMAKEFINIDFEMPEVNDILEYIGNLIESDIEEKVKNGKAKMDNIEGEIEEKIEDIKPKIISEIREMGSKIENQNSQIQSSLQEIDVAIIQKQIPSIDRYTRDFVENRYYIGLGMSSLILLILVCFIMGLFYGMCGKRPGGYYEDYCCNRGTGANYLTAAVYSTFLLSFVLLVLTSAHFLLGASLKKIICDTIQTPGRSDVFHQLDTEYFQPHLKDILSEAPSSNIMIERCHSNQTIFSVLQLERKYNLSRLASWRDDYGIGEYIENLRNKIQLEELSHITLLTPETAEDLQQLAKSNISDIDFSKFTDLLENEVTKIDLESFIERLKDLKDQVYRLDATRSIAPKLENQALWLGTMNKLVKKMKSVVQNLKVTVEELDENSKFNHSSMREAIYSLLNQTHRATEVIQNDGPELVASLTEQYVTETVDIIDNYVDRVISTIQYEVGFCAPLSASYNATAISICQQVLDPLNGFWASIGWSFLLFLPSIALSTSLISLYRKSEPYPGPLLDTQPSQPRQTKQPQRKGHTRMASNMLPEYTHARPAPSSQAAQGRFRDIAPANWGREAAQPPRYTSTPSLAGAPPTGEYERPPPYYYPGPQQGAGK